MYKKTLIINYILLFISIILFIFINLNNNYGIPYLFCLFFFLLLVFLNFALGIIINKKDFYHKNINIYIFLYFLLLTSLTLFVYRSSIKFLTFEHFKTYITSINIIPFKTISSYLFGNSDLKNVLYNILGNFVALMPIPLLLLLKDDKYKNLKKQIIFLTLTVLLIEILQLITTTGRFDIDDFILNISGAILFYLFLTKLNLIKYIKVLFYRDFNLNVKIKFIIYIFLALLTIIINIIIIYEISSSINNYNNNYQAFYIEKIDNCNDYKSTYFVNEDYKVYLNCINIFYKTMDSTQISIKEAFEHQYINKLYFINNFNLLHSLQNGEISIYTNEFDNLKVIICNSEENKNIYMNDVEVVITEEYCQH